MSPKRTVKSTPVYRLYSIVQVYAHTMSRPVLSETRVLRVRDLHRRRVITTLAEKWSVKKLDNPFISSHTTNEVTL